MDERELDLVRRCQRGEASAFEALYAAHAGRAAAYLKRCGFSPHDADDLTQETFVRVFKSIGTFDASRGSFAGWLAAIARNVARRRWERRPAAEDFDPQLAEDTLAAPDNPGQDSASREELQAVRQCVAALPAELARVVRLRYVEGRTTRSIAQVAGLPEATVRLRLKEAAAMIRECLKARGVLE